MLYDLTSFYYPLPLCLRFSSLTQSLSTLDIIGLAGACRGGIASLAAVRTVGNNCIIDRRKLVRTKTQYAERHPQGVCRIRKEAKPPTAAQQRVVEVTASRLARTHGGERSNAATQALSFHRHRTSSRSRLPMRAFLFGDIKGAVLFCEREQPPLTRVPLRGAGTETALSRCITPAP